VDEPEEEEFYPDDDDIVKELKLDTGLAPAAAAAGPVAEATLSPFGPGRSGGSFFRPPGPKRLQALAKQGMRW
jgi:hypothetical protein